MYNYASMWSPSYMFPHQNSVCIYLLLCITGYIKNAQNPTRNLQSPTIFSLLFEELIVIKGQL